MPDEEFSGWKERFQAQSAKAPKVDVFYHEQAMPEFVNRSKTRIVYSEHYQWYKEAKITLSSYSVLIKEDEQLEDRTRKLPGDRNKLEFFTKHWSLIIFHHAEQVPLSETARKAADAARGLQGTTDGKRVFVFSRAFLDLSRQNKRKLFPMGYDDKSESEPEVKRKQTTDTNKAGVRKRIKMSSQPRIVGGKIDRKSFNKSGPLDHSSLNYRRPFTEPSDKDEKNTNNNDVLQDTYVDDVAKVHTNGSNMTDSPITSQEQLRTDQPAQVSDQTGSVFLTGKLLIKDIDLQDPLAQGEPVVGLEKISKDIESPSEPPAESDNPEATSVQIEKLHDDTVHNGTMQDNNVQDDEVHDDNNKVHDDKVLDDNDTPINGEP